ncbi:hypothetical protein ACHQM5_030202 [Ranunculus cassubicifolius]
MAKITSKDSTTEENQESREYQPLIPGLPDEVAENCLLHLPYPYQTLVRSVSSSWNRAINDPIYQLSRKSLYESQPYIFVYAFQKSTAKIQWQAYNPRSSRWFILPSMPFSSPGFATASVPSQGKLYVLGGMGSDTKSPLRSVITYSTSTNKWEYASSMLSPRAFCAAGSIGSKIFAAGGGYEVGRQEAVQSMERYDTETDTWSSVAGMQWGLKRYDSVVIGSKLYITEGWSWPFDVVPRGGVYDAVKNKWEVMSIGMREGWIGVSVVVNDMFFVISEYGDIRVKFYVPDKDTWQCVEGEGFPYQAVKRPFSASAVDGKIFVVSCGLKVVVGSVFPVEKGLLRVEWEAVDAPKAFESFVPATSQIVYG